MAAAIASGRAHLGDAAKPNDPPADPGLAGWQKRMVGTGTNEHEEWMPQGERIGWLDGADLFLLPDAAYASAQRMATAQGSALGTGQRTLWKRLGEAGLIASRETGRGRHTVRRTVGSKKRPVVHLKVSALYADKSGPNGPSGPEAQISAGQGPFSGAVFSEEGRKKAPGIGPEAAEILGPGPEGPLGPFPETTQGEEVEIEL